jgi:hypothetical protein
VLPHIIAQVIGAYSPWVLAYVASGNGTDVIAAGWHQWLREHSPGHMPPRRSCRSRDDLLLHHRDPRPTDERAGGFHRPMAWRSRSFTWSAFL